MTRAGWGWLAGSVVLYAAGWWLGYGDLALLGLAGLLVLMVGAVWVARRPRLEVGRRIDPERVTVGELAEGLVTVTNPTGRTSPTNVCREVIGPLGVEVVVPRLAPGQSLTLPYPLPTDRRSVVTVGPLLLTRSDAFGLLERSTDHGEPCTLWVHPRHHALAPLPLGRRRDIEGPTTETERGAMVFHALREYVIGDDLRHVHWKATAHTGNLMIREHVDPARPDATVVLDDREPALSPGGFELAVEIVASVAVASLRQGFPVRLLSVTGRTELGEGATASRAALLDVLAGAGQHGESTLHRLEGALLTGQGGRALVVVTGQVTGADLARFAAFARRFDTVIVVAVGASAGPSDQPSGVQVVPVTDAESFVAAWGVLR